MDKVSKVCSESLEYCPHCGSNLQGELIPEKSQHLYRATHFSRKIGITHMELERTVAFICPDCGGEWNRDLNIKKGFPFLIFDPFDPRNRSSSIVGWLKIGTIATEIPIAKSKDDGFYMEHDLKNIKLGWLFMDTQSNINQLSMNTVLIDHKTLNGQMFETIKRILYSPVDIEPESKIIKLTTPHCQLHFEVCSVFEADSDDWQYIRQSFHNDSDKQEFVDSIREKNKMQVLNKPDLSIHDNFITISTCQVISGNNKNLVVHARLILDNR